MLAKLENWIRDFTEDKAAAPSGDAEWTRALAGLQLGTAEIDAIINGAVDSHEERVEIYGLARSIRAETEPDDRIAIMEMAWMVVLADGELHDYESQLMRRLAGLLYVDDIESGRAAKRARARLSQDG